MGILDKLIGNRNIDQDVSKKGVTNTISNNSDPHLIMYAHPLQDFNNNSTLVVEENQTVLFLKGGSIAGIYSEATPEKGIRLSTSNYPGIRAIAEALNGGASQYKCRVVFVRHNISSPVDWGTPVGLGEIESSMNGIIQNYIGHVQYSFKVKNPRAFYAQFGFQNVTTEMVSEMLRGKIGTVFQSVLKTALSCPGKKPADWIADLQDEEVSDFQRKFINKLNRNNLLEELGIELFNVNPHIQMTDDGLLGYSRERNALILELERRKILGDRYAESEHNKIMHKVAENAQAAGTAMGMIGLNMGNSFSPIPTTGATTPGGWDDPWNSSGVDQPPIHEPKDIRDLDREYIDAQINDLKAKISRLKKAYEDGDIDDQEIYKEKLSKYQKQLYELL